MRLVSSAGKALGFGDLGGGHLMPLYVALSRDPEPHHAEDGPGGGAEAPRDRARLA